MDENNEFKDAEYTEVKQKPKKRPSINKNSILTILAIFVLGSFIWKGFYKLDSGYVGVVTRFGEVVRVEEQEGFKFMIPAIEYVEKVNIEKRYKLEYGFRTSIEGSETRATEYEVYDDESLVIVDAIGDNSSLILTELIITYKVNDPMNFLYSVDDVEGTIRLALESVLRDTIAKHSRDEALLEKQVIDSEIMPELQKRLNSYDAGVLVTEVKTQNNTLLPSVEEAYREVEQANQSKNAKLEQAQKYRNTIIPSAESEATALKESAKTYRANTLATAKSEVAQFDALYSEYKLNPAIVKERYYIQTMQEFLANNKIILDGTKSSSIYKFFNMKEEDLLENNQKVITNSDK